MLHVLEESLRRAIAAHLKQAGAEFDAERIRFEVPPSPAMGDLASPAAFELAKVMRKAPGAVARELAAALASVPGVARVEAAASGHLNVFLDRSSVLAGLASPEPLRPAYGEKIIVEHTNINPNKAAHVGHLRNAVLGDTWVRMLRASGERVEVQNLIDDLGLQVADVVNAFLHMQGKTAEETAAISQRKDFDAVCWDVYAEVQGWYEGGKEREALRRSTLHALESGTGPESRMGRSVAEAVCRTHARLMEDLGIRYDLLVWESDIVQARLWKEAFERLKATGGIVLENAGKNAGCWVMPLGRSEKAEFKNLEDPDKVILRSDGTATYVAKDIALQMFKHGLVEARFGYRHFLYYGDGEPLWRSRAGEGGEKKHPAFGHGTKVYNVIDVRQSYLQHVVAESLRLCGFEEQARNSIHFAYEMVALTPATAEALGFELEAEERKKPYVEMSGRRGLGVKAGDLLALLEARALQEVSKRNPDFEEAVLRETARRIATGALRYFMLRFTRNKVVAFDLDEAVHFEGETGPYLQYAAVRVKNIFTKVAGAQGKNPDVLRKEALSACRAFGEWRLDDSAWALLTKAVALEQALSSAIASEEPAQFAKYAFDLARCWNGFYHANPILHEEDETLRRQRLAAAAVFERRLHAALEILGIGVPERM
jgi:arginyl-tRNA synthetase